MSRIFFGSLVILLITGQIAAQIALSLTTVNTLITWSGVYQRVKSSLTDDTTENIKKILKRVNRISTDFANLQAHISTQLDTMLNTLLNHIELTAELQSLKTQLLDYLHTVDYSHDESLKYLPGKYSNSTLKGFTDSVLFGAGNLPRIVVRMHDIFNPGVHVHFSQGFLSLIIEKAKLNLPTDCQRQTSPQQLMYYLYVQLILAEMKALATMEKVYILKLWLENSAFSYKTEIKEVRRNFKTGVRKYHRLFTKQLALLPRHVRRCHINAPQPGVDFIELQKLCRVKLVKPDYGQQLRCNCCLFPKAFYNENGLKMRVHSCKSLSKFVKACPAKPRRLSWQSSDLGYDYSWWSDDNGDYGGDKSCAQPETFNAGSFVSGVAAVYALPAVQDCNNWYCSVDRYVEPYLDTRFWRISVDLQVSDVWNDMVVTGVRFIVRDAMIHLQIQEGKFSNNGMIYSDIAWKDVGRRHHYNGSRLWETIYYDGHLGAYEKTIYLDDVTVPENSVVTGVQLVKIRGESHFMLWVHATVFDFTTGKLKPWDSRWCYRDVCKNKIPTGDYARDRIEIDMSGADDPTKGTYFDYDPETNKKIKFTHTDVHKDAGRTTIPFFDVQPVQVQPAFPITGIGLYFRGKEGFGGYIAPRIFTLDVAELMAASKNKAHKSR